MATVVIQELVAAERTRGRGDCPPLPTLTDQEVWRVGFALHI